VRWRRQVGRQGGGRTQARRRWRTTGRWRTGRGALVTGGVEWRGGGVRGRRGYSSSGESQRRARMR
jgi:hypothetical protein